MILYLSYNPFMKQIIVISGKQYCGKDTLAKIILGKLAGFKRVGIGDAIKIEYAKRKSLTFEEIEKNKHLYRNDLIELGNWGRSKDGEYWLKCLVKMDKIIVPDVRFEKELNFFKRQGAYCIRVESSVENRAQRGIITNIDDRSETELDNYRNWDLIIENNSNLEALDKKADEICMLFTKFIG